MSTIADITEPVAAPSTGAQPSKLSQLEQLLKQGRTPSGLRARVEEATKERDQLATTLKERDASHEKLWAEQAELQRADSERHRREMELRAELSEASAARDVASRDATSWKHSSRQRRRPVQLEDAADAQRLEGRLRESEENGRHSKKRWPRQQRNGPAQGRRRPRRRARQEIFETSANEITNIWRRFEQVNKELWILLSLFAIACY